MADRSVSGDSVSLAANSTSTSNLVDQTYQVYKRRWFILFVICLLNISNAMVWITFSPIADVTAEKFKVDAFKVNVLSLVFLICSVPFGFCASWVLDTFGLRASILLSAWLNGVGALLRNVSVFDGIDDSARYPILLLGQTLAACAQPFVMFAPTKLAALWFAGNQRATANMLASMANPLGILTANVIVPAMVTSCDGHDIPSALWVMTGISLTGTMMATFGVCSSTPPTPPTASAEEDSEKFIDGLKKLLKNKNYWVLNITFGAGLAIFTSFTTFLDQILCPKGYSNSFAGLCGALMIAGGVLGAVVSGIYVDRSKKFAEVIKFSYAGAVMAGLAFTQVARLRDQSVLAATCITLFGVFGFAMYPISMEMSVEVTYPVAEATSSGLLIVSGQIQGIIIILVLQFLAQPLSPEDLAIGTGCSGGCSGNSTSQFTPQEWTVPNLVANGYAVIAVCIVLLLLRPDYKRLKAEKKILAERILNISHDLRS
ncbi:solute carrier family 49 member A3-like [Mytilus galloprovincialis]|uniref:MSFD7 n=1 Tax=Mytilus edulis TaxID=6550 RepID=A0A8S3SUI2_MYTED|nr:MSFD7 [Mytilus edulis]